MTEVGQFQLHQRNMARGAFAHQIHFRNIYRRKILRRKAENLIVTL